MELSIVWKKLFSFNDGDKIKIVLDQLIIKHKKQLDKINLNLDVIRN
jgi:hypothetical protein